MSTFSVYVESHDTMCNPNRVAFNYVMSVDDPQMDMCNEVYKKRGTESFIDAYEDMCTQYPDSSPFFKSLYDACHVSYISDIIDYIAEHQYFVFKLIVGDNAFCAALMYTGWEQGMEMTAAEYLK